MPTSVRKTEAAYFFWGGEMSNFYRLGDGYLFHAPLWRGGPLMGFYHSEGFFMATKALMFGSTIGHVDLSGRWVPSILERILAEPDPKKAKELGREVANFDPVRWSAVARTVMARAVFWKFYQNKKLVRLLVDTNKLELVEGSPRDIIWGVGLRWDDPKIEDRNNWRGTNWLGEVLMLIRSLFLVLDEEELAALDPFLIDNWGSRP